MSDHPRDFDDLGLRSDERAREELREEMRAHLEHRIDDLVAGGMASDEAERIAAAEFGDAARIEREVGRHRRRRARAGWARALVDGARQDLGFALRQLFRRPGFSLVAALTLALGIGATTAITSLVRAVVLDPLPFADPDQLVELEMVTPAGQDFSVSEPAFLEWRERLDGYEDVGAIAGRGATLRAPGEPTSIERGYANAGFFAMLGVEPVLGREFRPDEDEGWAAAPVAMVSESFWRSRLDGDPELAGRSVRLDELTLDVVGVYPDELSILFGDVPVVTPLAASSRMDRGEHYLMVVGRLSAGVGDEQGRREVERLAAWQSENYLADRDWSAKLTPLEETLIGAPTIRAGWVLLAAAGLLLAMACLNVSSLLLARGSTRARELGVRAALGAGRRRILRQLLTETGMLGLVGAVTGLVLAGLALPAVRSLAAGRVPRIESAELDPVAAGVALVFTLLATFGFGVIPVLRGGSSEGAALLSQRGGSDRRGRLRTVLVTGQLAVSLILLLGTGLLFRSFVQLASVDPGFDPRGALAFDLRMPDGSWSWQERGPLVAEILAAIEGVSGVEHVGATAVDPFSGNALGNFVAREDRMPDRAADFTPVHWRVVTPGFFDAMSTRILAGRSFEDADHEQSPVPILIGERLASELFGSPAEAIDRLMVWGDPGGSRMRVVGVAEQLRDVELGAEPERMVYRQHRDIPWAAMTVVARVRPGAGDVAAEIRAAVLATAPGLPMPEVRSLETSFDRALAEPRFNVVLLGAFAFSGLLLAVVGLYGLTAFEVRQRYREIGIRMSLGARPESVLRMIVRERLAITGAGIALGLLGAWLLVGLLESLLYGVTPGDPVTWILGVATLAGTAWIAAWIPARRATRVDPREVLSAE